MNKTTLFFTVFLTLFATFGLSGDIDTQIYKNIVIEREFCDYIYETDNANNPNQHANEIDFINCDKDIYIDGVNIANALVDFLKSKKTNEVIALFLIHAINIILFYLCVKYGFIAGNTFYKSKFLPGKK